MCVVCLAYLASCSSGGNGDDGGADNGSNDGTPWTYDTAWVTDSRTWGALWLAPCGTEPVIDACNRDLATRADEAEIGVIAWTDTRANTDWQEKMAAIVGIGHRAGRVVIGTMSKSMAWNELGPRPDSIMPAATRGPFGEIVIDDDPVAITPDPRYLYSILNRVWEDHLSAYTFGYVDAGVDALVLDEGAYKAEIIDFNPETLAGFKTWLTARNSPADLHALATGLGFADFASFDYAQVWRDRLPPGTTALSHADWNARYGLGIPLVEDYDKYRRSAAVEVITRIVTAAQGRARAQSGRALPFSINVNAITESAAPYLHLTDYLELETFFGESPRPLDDYYYYPEARAFAAVKFAAGLGLKGVVQDAIPTRLDLIARGRGRIESWMQINIAESHAAGGARVLTDGHDYDPARILPYYRFIARNPALFDLPAVTPRLALVQLWEQWDVEPKRNLEGASQILADAGYQYDVVFGAEDVRRNYPPQRYTLVAGRLAAHAVEIVPRLALGGLCSVGGTGLMLSENHAGMLLDYASNGGLLVVMAEPGEVAAGLAAATGPRADELLGYLNGGETGLGTGVIVHIPQVLGPTYQATVDAPGAAAVRAQLTDVLASRGIEPEVAYLSNPRAVSAFLYRAAERTVLHLVNFDHAMDTDTLTPVTDLALGIALDALPAATGWRVTWQRPEAPAPSANAATVAAGRLQVAVPLVAPWAVLQIEPQ